MVYITSIYLFDRVRFMKTLILYCVPKLIAIIYICTYNSNDCHTSYKHASPINDTINMINTVTSHTAYIIN